MCLEKDETKRANAIELLEHPFLQDAEIYKDEFSEQMNDHYEAKKEERQNMLDKSRKLNQSQKIKIMK